MAANSFEGSRLLSATAFLVRPIYANQRACQVCVGRDPRMDAIRLPGEIHVYRANHDSTMSRHLVVKRHEVFPVDCQNGTIPQYGVGKDSLIRDPLIGVPCLQGGHDIVPEIAKLHYR